MQAFIKTSLTSRIKVIFATSLLVTLVSILGLIVVESPVTYANNDTQLSTIYHVYLEDEYIGSVHDQSTIDNFISDKVAEKNNSDNQYIYGFGQEILFIPEWVFSANLNSDQVLEVLDQQLVLGIQAITVQFGEKILGHFASKEDAEQAINDYKQLYVDEEVLERLENNETDQNKELKVGETIITDVKLSEEVTFSESVVSESELLTVKEAVRLLEKGTLEDMIHQVVSGDTLYSIGEKYNLSQDQLLELNNDLDVDSILQLDQEINVTDYVPLVNVVVYEEQRKEEVIKAQKKTEETDELYRGETKKKQAGEDGKKEVHLAIEKVNGQVVEREVLDEKIIKEVKHDITLVGTKEIPSRGTGDFAWPAVGGYISSSYGSRWGSHHKGIDIARPTNHNILASDNGVVERTGYNSGYGNFVEINHNNGYKTLYAHLSSIEVSKGDTVPKGTKIGTMGTTGRSTGIHLHFEVKKNGSNINPTEVLN